MAIHRCLDLNLDDDISNSIVLCDNIIYIGYSKDLVIIPGVHDHNITVEEASEMIRIIQKWITMKEQEEGTE